MLIFAAAVFGCGKTPRPEAPDETFYIDLTPENLTANVGDTLTLTGAINSVEGLFAISFDLVYDTSIISIIDVSLPSQGILGQNAISFYENIDDGASISLGRTQTSGNDNVSASGPLFVVRFEAVSAGSTEMEYRDIYIIDETGQENGDMGVLELRGVGIVIE